ncbi:MAG: PQQ-binding-like beta-propeller repeat protein [Rubripirellula sp.]
MFVFEYQIEEGKAFNNPVERASVQGKERLVALNASDGKEAWNHEYDCPYNISYPSGPRCTPAIDGDRVYILGSEGDLRCLKIDDGELVWQKSLKRDLSAEVPLWGFAAHPLVDGDLLYTMVGGDGQGVVAFDKMTGEVRWKALDSNAGYCPPSIIEHGGTRQLIVFHPQAVVSLNPANGSEHWSIPIEPNYEMSICRPMISGDFLYASGLGNNSVMIKLNSEMPGAKELWRGELRTSVFSANATPLFVDGLLYGSDCQVGKFFAVDGKDGNPPLHSQPLVRDGLNEAGLVIDAVSIRSHPLPPIISDRAMTVENDDGQRDADDEVESGWQFDIDCHWITVSPSWM